jgi:endonuclease/exonuclease/phosphatase family metal-dependent hydrolase
MTAPLERFLESHPDAAAAWYPAMARVVGRALAIPGLRLWRPLARRVDAVAQPAGWTTILHDPAVAPPEHCTGLTVLSANVWHDWPRQHRWTQRLEAVARLIEDEQVDLVLLQEVARTPALPADRWLAERGGLALAFARTNGAIDAIGFEEGLAVLSRFPLGEVRLRQLSRGSNPLVRRVALSAQVYTPVGPVLAVSTHLGLGARHNPAQIRELRAWVAGISDGGVAVIGGDFNAEEAAPEIVRTREHWVDAFRQVHPDVATSTHSTRGLWGKWRGNRVLDYVFVLQPQGPEWTVVQADHVDAPGERHSDHRAVLTRIAAPATNG